MGDYFCAYSFNLLTEILFWLYVYTLVLNKAEFQNVFLCWWLTSLQGTAALPNSNVDGRE